MIALIRIISRGIPIIRVESGRIIIMLVLMVLVIQITKPTIHEGFIMGILGPELGKACVFNPLGVEGFCVWLGSEYSNSTSIPYKVVIFP